MTNPTRDDLVDAVSVLEDTGATPYALVIGTRAWNALRAWASENDEVLYKHTMQPTPQPMLGLPGLIFTPAEPYALYAVTKEKHDEILRDALVHPKRRSTSSGDVPREDTAVRT